LCAGRELLSVLCPEAFLSASAALAVDGRGRVSGTGPLALART
jgi:hypothetical protein